MLPLVSTERKSISNARVVIAGLALLALCAIAGFASSNSAAQQSSAHLRERSLQAELKQVAKPSTDFFTRAAFRSVCSVHLL
jgi:type II secretory pathway component PulJ